jgi:hypothetical protein
MRTIRGNLRGSNGVSFFAFQDVIMSVTGVVIVIALLLALQIDKIPDPGSADAAGAPDGISTDAESELASPGDLVKLEGELAAAKRRLAELQAGRRARETVEEIAAEIAQLEKSIARRLAKKKRNEENLNSEKVAPRDRVEAAKIAALQFQLDEARKKLRTMTPENKKLGARLRELEAKVRKTESAVLQSRENARDLVLIPEMTNTTKEAVIVDVTGDSLTARRFDRAGEKRLASDAGFSDFCRRLKPTEHYFVFFVRPSGALRFGNLRKIARRAGFEVGYDAIDEGTKLRIGKRKPK